MTLGLEAQHDNVRGDQAFAIARIRVPFAAFGGKGQADDLTALEQRMIGRIYRDVDIVSGESAPQLVSTEAGMFELDNGTQVSSFTTIDATGDIDADVAAAGNNALVVIDGSKGTINTADRIFAQAGQTLIGGGASISVVGASGTTATLTLPGSRPTIDSTYIEAVQGSVQFSGDDITVQNMTITADRIGIEVNNDDRITLRDLEIRDTGNDSIRIVQANDVLIENVRVYRPDGGAEEAIQLGSGGSATNNNITIKDFYAEDVNVGILIVQSSTTNGLSFDNVTINGTGNVLEVQNGPFDGVLNNPSGAITATNVSGADCVNNGVITGSSLTINGVACP